MPLGGGRREEGERSEPKAQCPVKGYVKCRAWLGVFPVSFQRQIEYLFWGVINGD